MMAWMQQERQKNNKFDRQNKQLYMSIMLFCTFLCRHCMTTM